VPYNRRMHPLTYRFLPLLLLVTVAPRARAVAEDESSDVRLIVLVVVDQMIPEQLDRLAPLYTGGFHRFATEGEVWCEGAHGHGLTETGPGHATIGTGAFPRHHGIVANHWPEPDGEGAVYCAHDPKVRVLTSDGAGGPGSSPANLERGGFSDFVKAADPEAKCVGIALKDRASILATGRSADWCLWWDGGGAGFIASTWYGEALPSWVVEWNDGWRERVATMTEETFAWNDELPADLARTGTAEDARAGEAGLLGRTEFPYVLRPDDEPEKRARAAAKFVYQSPYGDRYAVELAERAVEAMDLGGDEHPDFLFVGMSVCDTVGHQFGPYSREITDVLVRGDRELGELFALLDRRVGEGRWVAALTADHGVMPLTERLRARGIPAQRVSSRSLGEAQGKMREALQERFGDDCYLRWLDGVRFSPSRIAAAGTDPAEFRRVAAEVLAKSGAEILERVLTLEELQAAPEDLATDPLLTLMSHSTFAGRSPDLLVVTKRDQLLQSKGTSHGTPWSYDRRVPIVFLGPGSVPGRRWDACFTVDVLPTLLSRAGLAVPDGLDGRVLE